MKTTHALRLSLRFSLPRGYVSWARAVAVLVVSALLVTIPLAFFGALSVVDAQQGTVDARNPAYVVDDTEKLPMVGEFRHRWGRYDVERVVVASDVGSPASSQVTVPGIPELPSPGEVYVSPAYRSAMKTSSPLRDALASSVVVGEIQPAGLRGPAELRVIMGVPREGDLSHLSAVDHFGAPSTEPLVPLSGGLAFFAPAIVVLSLGPLLMALMLVNRLLADRAAVRYALFHSMGLRLRSCRLIAGVELMPFAIAGVVIGHALFEFASAHMQRLPGTDLTYWSADVSVGGAAKAAVAIAVALLTPLVAAVFTVKRPGLSTRPRPRQRQPRWWWTVPVVAGVVALLVALWLMPESSPRRKVVMVAAAATLLAGALPLLHALVHAIAVLLVRTAKSGGVLLGARWMSNRGGASFRLASLFAVGLLCLGLTAPFISLLRGDVAPGQDALAHAKGYNVVLTDLDQKPADLLALPETRFALPFYAYRDGSRTTVFVLSASCSDLDAIVDDVAGCDSARPQWINPHSGPADSFVAGLRAPLRAPGSHTFAELPRSTVNASIDGTFLGAVRVDPEAMDPVPTPEGFVVNLRNDGPSLDSFEAALVAIAPTSAAGNSYQDLVDQANALAGYLQLLVVAISIGLVGVLIAMIATGIRLASERHRVSTSLARIGATRRDRMTAHWLSQTGPLLVCTIAVLPVTGVFWACAEAIDPRMSVDLAAMLGASLVAVAAAAAIGCASYPFDRERPRTRRTSGTRESNTSPSLLETTRSDARD